MMATKWFAQNRTILKAYLGANFTYDGTNLIKIQSTDNRGKTEFTYSNGNVSTISYYGRSNNELELLGIQTLTFSNGNISQAITNDYQWDPSTTKTTFTYDTGNNPLRDISIYLRLSLVFEGLIL